MTRLDAKSRTSESQIVTAILDYLALIQIPAARTQAGAVATRRGHYLRLAPEGHPDITGCLPGGRALYIEVKTRTGSVSAAQHAWIQQLQDYGALVIVARSITDVEQALHASGVLTRERTGL